MTVDPLELGGMINLERLEQPQLQLQLLQLLRSRTKTNIKSNSDFSYFLDALEIFFEDLTLCGDDAGKLGLEHPDLGDILNTMGIANLERKNLVMASGQFERAKAISLKHFGGGHPNTLAATLNMVAAYSALNRWDKAIKCQAEVVKNLEEQNAEPEVLSRNREMLEKLQQIQANAATAAHSAGIS